jgi:hypothetical protein
MATKKKKVELRPCPFCGGKARIEKVELYSRSCYSNYDKYTVGCKGWVNGRMCVANRDRQNLGIAFDTREDAEMAWNRTGDEI